MERKTRFTYCKDDAAKKDPFPLRKWCWVGLALVAVWTATGSAQLPPANPQYQAGFPIALSGDFVRGASVTVADLHNGDNGVPEIIFGGGDGRVYAYTGSGGLLWEASLAAVSIDGKAAVGDVDGDGFPEVVVGLGSNSTPNGPGRVVVLDHLGVEQCHFDTLDPPALQGVYSSPALADLDGNDQGKLEIVFGAWDQRIRAIHDDCTLYWERIVFDTVYSSPAIADLDGDGVLEVVIGADAHYEGDLLGMEDGGRLFVLDGRTGLDRPGFPIQIDEVIHSSPAIGDVDGDGWLDIVVGTGDCWGANTGCAPRFYPGVGEYVNAWDRHGNTLAGWPIATPSQITYGSPALVDLDGDGNVEVVVNTLERGTSPQVGRVYIFEGDGSVLPGWPATPSTPADCQGTVVSYGTRSSPTVADIDGDGIPEILLVSNSEVVVWNVAGEQLSREALVPPVCQPPDASAYQLVTGWTTGGSPAIADVDGDGDFEIIIAGYFEKNQLTGGLWAWDFPGGSTDSRSWPMFRRSEKSDAVLDFAIFRDGFETGDTRRWN